MVKKVALFLSVAALAGAFLAPAFAAEKVKMSEVAPAADLLTEAKAAVASLETALASNDSYLKGKKKAIPKDAGLVAILAQSLAEYEGADVPVAAADLRDAAVSLAKSDSYDSAKAAFAKVKAAMGTKTSTAKSEHDWHGLIDLDSVMVEVNVRNGALRKQMRKVTDAETASRDAAVLAILAIAIAADTHEVKNKADVPKWEGYSADLRIQSAKVAAAMKKNDVEGGKEAFLAAAKSCSSCHADFRD